MIASKQALQWKLCVKIAHITGTDGKNSKRNKGRRTFRNNWFWQLFLFFAAHYHRYPIHSPMTSEVGISETLRIPFLFFSSKTSRSYVQEIGSLATKDHVESLFTMIVPAELLQDRLLLPWMLERSQSMHAGSSKFAHQERHLLE